MQNEWLKSILGEFQGYINEVKQNAQAQGINADFLDLQDGVLNHRAVVGEEEVSQNQILNYRGGLELRINSPLLTVDFEKVFKAKDYRMMRDLVTRYLYQKFPDSYAMRTAGRGYVIDLTYNPSSIGVSIKGTDDSFKLKDLGYIPPHNGGYFDKYYPFDLRDMYIFKERMNNGQSFYKDLDFIGQYNPTSFGIILGLETGKGRGNIKGEGYIEFDSGGYTFSLGPNAGSSLVSMSGYCLDKTLPRLTTFEGWGSSIGGSFIAGTAGLWMSDNGNAYSNFIDPTLSQLWKGYFGGVNVDLLDLNKVLTNPKELTKLRPSVSWARTYTKIIFPAPSTEGTVYFFDKDWLGDPRKDKY